MKRLLIIISTLAIVAGVAAAILPAFANPGDLNRYGMREYWEWYNAARVASVPAPTATPSTIITDTCTDTDGTNILSHIPDEIRGNGEWGDEYHPTQTGSQEILGNEIILSNSLADFKIGRGINLEWTGTITYTYMAGTDSNVAAYAGLAFRMQTGDALTLQDSPYQGKHKVSANVWANGAYSSALGSVSNISGSFSTMKPHKVVDTGTNVKYYFDVTGSEATTLRMDIDTATYNDHVAIAIVFGQLGGTWPRFDTLVAE